VLATGDALAQRLRLVEEADRVLERGLPRRGQLHPALGPNEERLPELRLERLDLVADRGLREAEPFGRAREVQGLGDHPERPELREFHLLSPGIKSSRDFMNDSREIKRIVRTLRPASSRLLRPIRARRARHAGACRAAHAS
jgi:hypothetical protein